MITYSVACPLLPWIFSHAFTCPPFKGFSTRLLAKMYERVFIDPQVDSSCEVSRLDLPLDDDPFDKVE